MKKKQKLLHNIIILILLFFIYSNTTYAYKMVTILGVSNTEKTLYVRLGFVDGIDEKMDATFTSDNLSIIARSLKVTKEYSIWKIIEPGGKIPFEKNQIVTFNFATEKIWMFDPNNFDSYRQKQLAEMEKMREEKKLMRSRANSPALISLRYYSSDGINQTTSVLTSSNTQSRQIKSFEAIFGYTYPNFIQLNLGIRYEEGATTATNAVIISKRGFVTTGINYYYYPIESNHYFYHYVGTTLGYGQTRTVIGPEELKGEAYLFPTIQTGFEYFTPIGLGIGVEAALESIHTQEWFSDNDRQDNSETNLRLGATLNFIF